MFAISMINCSVHHLLNKIKHVPYIINIVVRSMISIGSSYLWLLESAPRKIIKWYIAAQNPVNMFLENNTLTGTFPSWKDIASITITVTNGSVIATDFNLPFKAYGCNSRGGFLNIEGTEKQFLEMLNHITFNIHADSKINMTLRRNENDSSRNEYPIRILPQN